MPKRRIGGKGSLSVDFSGVESGGKAVPDGVYEVEVMEITEEEGDKAPYLKWVMQVTEGPAKGARLYENTSLSPAALFRLKGLLEVIGEEVPDGAMDLDLGEYVGRTLTVTVVNEEYQGKMRPKIAAYGGEGESHASGSPKDGKEDKAEAAETSSARRKAARRAAKDGFNEGDKVKFKEQGKTYKGEVVSIEGDTATVSVDDEEWELAVEDLEAA